jgi:hypothetical protein
MQNITGTKRASLVAGHYHTNVTRGRVHTPQHVTKNTILEPAERGSKSFLLCNMPLPPQV